MSNDYITLLIGDKEYTGWKGITVGFSLDQLCRTISVSVSEKIANQILLYPQLPVEVFIGTDPLFTGYIDKLSRSIAGSSHTTTANGRGITSDLVDCSNMVSPNTWYNLKLEQLVKKITDSILLTSTNPDLSKKFKVITNTNTGSKFSSFSVESGESYFESILRACRIKNVVPITNGSGEIVLESMDQPTQIDGELKLGNNVVSADTNFDFTNRFSHYVVKGKSIAVGSGWDKKTINVNSTVEDEGIERYRPTLIDATDINSIEDANVKGYWAYSARVWESIVCNVRLNGFRDINNNLWNINTFIKTVMPQLSLDKHMLISGVDFSVDNSGGCTTSLGLSSIGAFRQAQAKIKKVDSPKGSW